MKKHTRVCSCLSVDLHITPIYASVALIPRFKQRPIGTVKASTGRLLPSIVPSDPSLSITI